MFVRPRDVSILIVIIVASAWVNLYGHDAAVGDADVREFVRPALRQPRVADDEIHRLPPPVTASPCRDRAAAMRNHLWDSLEAVAGVANPPRRAPGWLSSAEASLFGRALIAQYIADRQDQIAAEIIRCLAARILDSVVTSIISELPVLEFAITVLNDFGANLSAKEII